MAQDPKHAGPTPPQPEQQQEPPGHTAEMTPKPDHGEESYKGCGKLEGRAAIITGGDSGIGRAVAIAFAREGADVLISYLPEEEDDARETARWVEQAGRRVVLVPGDIADQQHCKEHRRARRLRVRQARHSRQQRRLPAHLREDRGHHRGGVGPHLPRQHPRHVLPVPGRRAAHEAGRGDREHDVDPVEGSLAPAPRLRLHQGRDLELHGRPGADAGGPRHPRERGGAGPDLDAAHPLDDAGGEGGELRPAEPAFARGPAKELAPAFVLLASDEASYMSGAVVPVTGGQPML